MLRSNKHYPLKRTGALSILSLCLAISATPGLGQTGSKQVLTLVTQGAPDTQKALALAEFYYKNGDITDRAAVQYRRVRDMSPKSSEGATAQYYLGSYYHRKFYIQKEKKLKEDVGLLIEAQGQYEDYANRYAWSSPSPQWISDAYFNLALIFLQRGDSAKAEQLLGKVYGAAPYDAQVYIYQVVWSPNSNDVVDAHVDARGLAEFTNSLVYEAKKGPQPFEQLVERIRQWCASQKK